MDFSEINVDLDQEVNAKQLLDMRKSFEAGGTKLWGADFGLSSVDSDTDSHLSPICEGDYEAATDKRTIMATDSHSLTSLTDSVATASPAPMRRRQSEFRSTLLKHKQLWQRAAQRAKGGGLEYRRKSILPIDDITDDLVRKISTSTVSEDEDSQEPVTEDEVSVRQPSPILSPPLSLPLPDKPVFKTSRQCSTSASNVNIKVALPPHTPGLRNGPHSHLSKVSPLTDLEIEKNVKPQLRPAAAFFGFILPRLPNQFTTDVSESLYQKHHNCKKKRSILKVNLLYCFMIVFVFIVRMLPNLPITLPLNTWHFLQEGVITIVLSAIHMIVCILIAKANTAGEIRICAYITWSALLLQSLVSSIASYLDTRVHVQPTTANTNDILLPWNQFSMWQTCLAVFTTFHFLSVISIRRLIVLAAVMILTHLMTTLVLHLVSRQAECLVQILVDLVILMTVYAAGLLNNYMVDRTERKAFLEIRTCIESRHTIAKENQHQERLVLSVLPKFIVNDILKEPETSHSAFFNMYMHRYEDVSILFADICGFTTLSSLLTARQLVNMLNDLFAKFDKLAKKNKCLRIKLLGDCYECVCGIPQYQKDHADNCVTMGLDMIDAIRLVREQQNVQVLDMRIGVHTGSVLCGVLGLRKWQFDIYSDDVKTANAMESSGQKGRVHISEATLESLQGKFDIEENTDLQDDYLNNMGLKTYFICPAVKAKKSCESKFIKVDCHMADSDILSKAVESRRPTSHSVEFAAEGGASIELGRTRYHHLRHSTDTTVNKMLERATDSNADDKLCKTFINSCTLTYKDREQEEEYRDGSDDSSFQTNLALFALISVSVLLTQAVSNDFTVPLSALVLVLTAVVLFSTLGLLFTILLSRIVKYYRKRKGLISNHSCTDSLLSHDSDPEQNDTSMTNRFVIRNSVIGLLVAGLLATTIVNLVFMRSELWYNEDYPKSNDATCFSSYTWISWLLMMIGMVTFLKWMYILKVIALLLSLAVYLSVSELTASSSIGDLYDDLTSSANASTYRVNPALNISIALPASSLYMQLTFYSRIQYIGVLTFAAILLIYHSYVLELHSRLDFLWKLQAKQELQEMDRLRESNLLLLRNILPEHVAVHFLGRKRRDEELYSESYDNVAVMFASISNFNEFWLAVPGNDDGRGCLMILNEIIADFDELLGQPAYVEVEKIKTIGSTYMTCVGLSPVQKSENNSWQNLKTCVDMAFEMQRVLAEINQNTFNNNFQLRIGINHGPVVAGVIGAQKPHYDIWGHTVNLASRMESSGIEGKVQVMEKTAEILKRNGYLCTYHATKKIKGIDKPVKVYTVVEPKKSIHRNLLRRGSIAATPTSPDSVVTKLMVNPSIRRSSSHCHC